MPFDAFVMSAVAQEIADKIIKSQGRVQRIYQLSPHELLLYFKVEKGGETLFLSIHPRRGRIHLTKGHYHHPQSPPPFCMLLRKHLGNGLLVSIEQPPLERVLYLNFEVLNERGSKTTKTLALEIMGRHSNAVLLDAPAEGKREILGVLKPIFSSINRVRILLPHHPYYPPPLQEKLHPLALEYENFRREISTFQGQPASKTLLENLHGLSPFLAEEIAARADAPYISPHTIEPLWEKLQEILQIYIEKKWEPTLLYDENNIPLDFTVVKPRQKGNFRLRFSASISELLDEFYKIKEREEEKKSLFSFLTRHVEQALKKNLNKEEIQLKELEASEKADYYRQCGELILMNLSQIPSGARLVEVENIFLEPSEKIKIPLDPLLSASSNAQRYFKKYRKARQGKKKIAENLEKTRQEISYLESVLFALKEADLQSLREIKEELEETGYLPVASKGRSPLKKSFTFQPYVFISSAGEEILVGRNNRQNEYLIRHFSSKNFLWFHVKDLPGAHVIIRASSPSEKTIKEAAALAAYFSRAAQSSKVPVDYTLVKNVHRLPGGKPGMVTYTNFKTLFVTPDRETLSPLLAQQKSLGEERL